MEKGRAESEGWPWPDALDAVTAAGEFHRVLFENERVRVLEVKIGQGKIVPVHTHQWPSALYTDSFSHFVRRDGEGNVTFDSRNAGPPPKTGTAQWLPALPPHSVENVGDADVRLISVELKEPAANAD
jgi:quercetin dioxygenase-like cupin family protein